VPRASRDAIVGWLDGGQLTGSPNAGAARLVSNSRAAWSFVVQPLGG
jgi:hypothetical protein